MEVMNLRPDYHKFANLLEERDVTANKVSKDTGVSTAILTYWKTGRSSPKIDKIQKIADYFGVPIEFFLEE